MKTRFILFIAMLFCFVCCACSNVQETPAPKHTQCSHDYELVRTVDRTCTEDGRAYYQCKLCGKEMSSITEKAAGHTPKLRYPNTKKPTCTSVGTEEQVCSVCGESYIITLPKLSHNYKNHICTMCGDADKPMFFTDLKLEKKSGDIIVFSAYFHNYTGKKLEYVEVTLELMDSKGNVIDTDWTYAVGSEGIKDKSKAYFDIWYSGVSYFDISSWSLAVKDYRYA